MTGLEFAAVALAGVLIGRFLPNRRKGPKPAKPVEPLCGCEHHHSFHDPQTGRCSGQVQIGYWNSEYHYKTCTCRQYSGPQPMPEFFAPEVSA
jgi:hypothetical protein